MFLKLNYGCPRSSKLQFVAHKFMHVLWESTLRLGFFWCSKVKLLGDRVLEGGQSSSWREGNHSTLERQTLTVIHSSITLWHNKYNNLQLTTQHQNYCIHSFWIIHFILQFTTVHYKLPVINEQHKYTNNSKFSPLHVLSLFKIIANKCTVKTAEFKQFSCPPFRLSRCRQSVRSLRRS